MADEKKYVDPNPFADYGAAMKSTPGNPMAVEWQNAQEAALVAATSDAALEACVATPAAAEALLAQLKGAYDTDPLVMTQIAAVTQYVMTFLVGKKGCGGVCRQKNGPRCRRGLWQGALLKACAATRDAYVQTFLLDQLRWCGCGRHVAAVRALVPVAAEVKSYIAWTASEIDGSAF